MDSKARCFHDAEFPEGSGLRSVISEAILDTKTSADTFWKQTKEYIRGQAHEILPDGAVVQRLRSKWRFWDGSLYYTKHVFDDATHEVRSYSYGADPSMSAESLRRVSHLRVHWEPYRLEMFTIVPEHSAAGEPEKAFLVELLAPVFSSRRGQEEASSQVLARL